MSTRGGAETLVDTHCHLVLLAERGLLDRALEGAAAAGVAQIVSVGLNVDDSLANMRIAEAHDNVWFSVGWHPHQSSAPDPVEVHALDELLAHPRAVAVGEIGLDLFFRPGYHETPLEEQQRALHTMYELAATHRKPVIVHDRDAHDEVLDAIRAHPEVLGVMHCFSGDAAFARDCVASGYVVSLSGIVTFPRSEPQQEAAAQVSSADYVVETDAPFLAPVPFRGRPNLPEYVAATASAVARLRSVDDAVVRAETTANARRLFALPDPSA